MQLVEVSAVGHMYHAGKTLRQHRFFGYFPYSVDCQRQEEQKPNQMPALKKTVLQSISVPVALSSTKQAY